MNKLKEAAQLGNNIEAAKAKRIVINLFDISGSNTNVFGQYFFDEYPELNNKTIVGIKFNTATGVQVGNFPDFGQFNTSIDNNIGIDAQLCQSRDARYLMINLFNEKNELIIQNMPINSLNSNTSDFISGKIKPFNTKLNLKASYIFSTVAFTAANPTSVSFTFYYLDK